MAADDVKAVEPQAQATTDVRTLTASEKARLEERASVPNVQGYALPFLDDGPQRDDESWRDYLARIARASVVGGNKPPAPKK